MLIRLCVAFLYCAGLMSVLCGCVNYRPRVLREGTSLSRKGRHLRETGSRSKEPSPRKERKGSGNCIERLLFNAAADCCAELFCALLAGIVADIATSASGQGRDDYEEDERKEKLSVDEPDEDILRESIIPESMRR